MKKIVLIAFAIFFLIIFSPKVNAGTIAVCNGVLYECPDGKNCACCTNGYFMCSGDYITKCKNDGNAYCTLEITDFGRGFKDVCTGQELLVFGKLTEAAGGSNIESDLSSFTPDCTRVLNPTTSFDVSSITPDHEVTAGLFTRTLLPGTYTLTTEYHRARDDFLIIKWTNTLTPTITSTYRHASYVGYVPCEINENGNYYVKWTITDSAGNLVDSKRIDFTITGIGNPLLPFTLTVTPTETKPNKEIKITVSACGDTGKGYNVGINQMWYAKSYSWKDYCFCTTGVSKACNTVGVTGCENTWTVTESTPGTYYYEGGVYTKESPSSWKWTVPQEVGVTVTAPDTTPPSVGSISPTSATVNQATTFSTSVSDNIAVTGCSLYVDGNNVGSMSLSSSPCASCTASRSHTFTSIGSYSVYAYCQDAAGNTAQGSSVSVTVKYATQITDFSFDPTTITLGEQTAVRGWLKKTDGTGIGGKTVNLRVYNPSTALWDFVTSGTTSSTSPDVGYVGFYWTPTSSYVGTKNYKLEFAGDASYSESWSAAKSLTVTADTTPPTGSITIKNGDIYTTSTSVTLTLSCTDTSGCSQMKFSNDDSAWSTAEAYSTSKSWTLTSGSGTKTVYARFKDTAGNWMASSVSDTIILATECEQKCYGLGYSYALCDLTPNNEFDCVDSTAGKMKNWKDSGGKYGCGWWANCWCYNEYYCSKYTGWKCWDSMIGDNFNRRCDKSIGKIVYDCYYYTYDGCSSGWVGTCYAKEDSKVYAEVAGGLEYTIADCTSCSKKTEVTGISCECYADADCPASKPRCKDNKCVECKENDLKSLEDDSNNLNTNNDRSSDCMNNPVRLSEGKTRCRTESGVDQYTCVLPASCNRNADCPTNECCTADPTLGTKAEFEGSCVEIGTSGGLRQPYLCTR